MIEVIAVDTANFEQEVVQQTTRPVVVEFWTEGCQPCQALGQAIRQFSGQLKIVTCDVDASPDLAARYGVLNIPTVLFFKHGQMVDRAIGYMNDVSKEEVAAKCRAVLGDSPPSA